LSFSLVALHEVAIDITNIVKSKCLISFFLIWRLTTEAMCIWRFAGAFAVVKRQSELQISVANAGAKPAKCTSTSQ
jgi:hypothetical protein